MQFAFLLVASCLVAHSGAGPGAQSPKLRLWTKVHSEALTDPPTDVLLLAADQETMVIDQATGGYSHVKIGTTPTPPAISAPQPVEDDYLRSITREEAQQMLRQLNVASNSENLELVEPGQTMEL